VAVAAVAAALIGGEEEDGEKEGTRKPVIN